MVIGQAHEGRGALGRRLGHGGPALCHLDDLGRSVHDDMTIRRGETFTTGFSRTAPWRVRSCQSVKACAGPGDGNLGLRGPN
jgi:hypothetical protein